MWYNMICGFKPRFVCYGGVAQLGERCVRNAEVMGSNPTISTKNSECFATGGKGQSGDVGYGVADYGCAVFL